MRDVLTKKHLNRVRTGDEFYAFVDDVMDLLPRELSLVRYRQRGGRKRDLTDASLPTITDRAQFVYDSLRYLAGETLTKEVLDTLCWRLAGNLKQLRRFKPVTPWAIQRAKEWVPVQIVAARKKQGGRGDLGYAYTFKIMAGSPCPLAMVKFWSLRFVRYVAPLLGFVMRPPPEKSDRLARWMYHHPMELVGMRLLAFVDPALSVGEPGFDRIKVAPSLRDYNRTLLKYRDRLPVDRDETDYSCPFNVPLTVLCSNCAKGWQSCRAGCHRLDYVFQFCGTCNQENSPFDNDLSTEMCVHCYERRAARKG